MKYKVIIKEDLEDGGYTVSCPAIPGCHSQGDTIDEAIENIKDAIVGCMEVINERTTKKVDGKAVEVVL
jgi:predicted RNase H-like HicB family nuclease